MHHHMGCGAMDHEHQLHHHEASSSTHTLLYEALPSPCSARKHFGSLNTLTFKGRVKASERHKFLPLLVKNVQHFNAVHHQTNLGK